MESPEHVFKSVLLSEFGIKVLSREKSVLLEKELQC